jgi:peptide-methionine (S)-S-oxide reductase
MLGLKKRSIYMKSIFSAIIIVLVVFGELNCREMKSQNKMKEETAMDNVSVGTDTATFGQGCFWCAEAIFERVEGVKSVVSGYAGGSVPNPTYEQVCNGNTGHAEVVQIVYDPKVISYDDLLKIFWKTHDPTTLNRQGADVGTQYRSIILYHNEKQKEKAEYYKKELDNSGAWDKPIVTQIVPFTKFYRAEDYHQDYFEKNPHQGYCSFVIAPKVEKFEKVFKDKLKK